MTESFSLYRLEQTILARKQADENDSYVASLCRKGVKHIAKKVSEEAAEVAMAAVGEGREQLVYESADLLFHLMVLCAQSGIALEDVLAELARREGISGIEEKKSRKE